jgi:hypothetical protein
MIRTGRDAEAMVSTPRHGPLRNSRAPSEHHSPRMRESGAHLWDMKKAVTHVLPGHGLDLLRARRNSNPNLLIRRREVRCRTSGRQPLDGSVPHRVIAVPGTDVDLGRGSRSAEAPSPIASVRLARPAARVGPAHPRPDRPSLSVEGGDLASGSWVGRRAHSRNA